MRGQDPQLPWLLVFQCSVSICIVSLSISGSRFCFLMLANPKGDVSDRLPFLRRPPSGALLSPFLGFRVPLLK